MKLPFTSIRLIHRIFTYYDGAKIQLIFIINKKTTLKDVGLQTKKQSLTNKKVQMVTN